MEIRSSSPTDSPSTPMRRPKRWALKCERYCCSVAVNFPLAFVYGTTTWAVWVQANLGFESNGTTLMASISSIVGVILYILLNWSYTVAVFTDPGSPSTAVSGSGYSHLPAQDPSLRASLTVKSTGGSRYCKKCSAPKPDRAHHCSTCGRCVLKMDHHCPWLAACVGLRNYKPFLLFLVYTSAFCWLCFAVTGTWLMREVLGDTSYTDSLMPIHYVLLCTISGIIGLVLTVFTGWHISLAWKGQTTIECLEKTRYLTPLKRTMRRSQSMNKNVDGGQTYDQQLAEIHSNMLPGITRAEEGQELITSNRDLEQGSVGPYSSHGDYSKLERYRERKRYEEYMDELDSEKLPNAFDLGWKKNLSHLFGHRLWLLPICNTTGDGWTWEPSAKWVEEREKIRRQRERLWIESEDRDNTRGNERCEEYDHPERHYLTSTNGEAVVPGTGRRSPGKADQILGRPDNGYFDKDFADQRPSSRISMQTLRRRESFSDSGREVEDGLSSDEGRHRRGDESQYRTEDEWQDWD